MSDKQIRVGVIGLGFMGRAHAAAYERIPNAKIVAVADADPARRQGKSDVQGNIEVPLPKLDVANYEVFADGRDLIRSADVDLVDICIPTFLHKEMAIMAADKGRHVMVEKPLAMNSDEAADMIAAANRNGVEMMVGQCLRFWPEYLYLKETLDSGRWGKMLKGQFMRQASKPVWSWESWYNDHVRSGGAIWDLHIHDVDFINYLLGTPDRIYSRCITTPATGGYDLVSSLYTYDGGPEILVDAAWYQATNYGFHAGYLVTFEGGLVQYDGTRKPTLAVYPVDGEPEEIALEGDAYFNELEFLIDCLVAGKSPASKVDPESVRRSLMMAEAEKRSSETGQVVKM